MVSILLTVLKIIGIVVLVILALILFVLLLVMFVPVRYRANGSYQDGTFMTRLRVSWLLHMVSVKGDFQNGQELHIVLKILGIPFFDTLRNKKTKPTKTKVKPTGEIQAASSENDSDNESYEDIMYDSYEKTETDRTQDFDVTPEWPETKKLDTAAQSGAKKRNIFQKIEEFIGKFVSFFINIKFTFDKVCDTIVRIKNNINYYLELLQSDSTKQALIVCRGQFGRILKKVAPRKFKVNLHLGFEDPAVMGQVLAMWGMLYPLHQGRIDIQPEFDRAVMEGEFSFQGRIPVFVFVHAGCILFFNKDIKRLIKSLRQKVV